MKFLFRSIFPLLFSFTCVARMNQIQYVEDFATLPMPVSDISATYDEATDRIYLIGGCDDPQGNTQLTPDLFVCFSITEKGFVFNPNDGSFEAIPDAPRARYRHTAASLAGKIWLVGGRTVEDDVIPEIDVYDPIEKVWTAIGSLPQELQFSDQASFVHDGYMYIVGGYEQAYAAKDTTFRLPASSFEDGLSTEVMGTLNEARGDIHAVILDDSAYITGGYTHDDGEGGFCVPHSSTERYDVKQDTWTTIDDLENGRADKALVALNGHVYAIGGETKEKALCTGDVSEYTMALNDVEVLEDAHLKSSKWQVVADTPAHVFRFTGAAHPPSNSIFTFGGQNFYSDTCECFATSDAVTKYVEVPSEASSAFAHHMETFIIGTSLFVLLNIL